VRPLHHEKALAITMTLLKEKEYKTDVEIPIAPMMAGWKLPHPRIKRIEHKLS